MTKKFDEILDMVCEMDLDEQVDMIRTLADNLELDIEMRDSSEQTDITDRQRSLAVEAHELGHRLEIIIRKYHETKKEKV